MMLYISTDKLESGGRCLYGFKDAHWSLGSLLVRNESIEGNVTGS